MLYFIMTQANALHCGGYLPRGTEQKARMPAFQPARAKAVTFGPSTPTLVVFVWREIILCDIASTAHVQPLCRECCALPE